MLPAPRTVPTPPAATSAQRGGLWWAAWPGLGAQVLLGSSVAVISATNQLPVLAVQAVRYALAAVTVVVLARVARVRLVRPTGADLLRVVGGALTGLVGFNLAAIIGSRHAHPAALGAAVACIPVVLALVGPLTRRRHPARQVVLGAVVVSGGAVAVTGVGGADPVGVAAGVALIGCEAAFTLCGAPALPRMGAWSYSAATSTVAALVFAVTSLTAERPEAATFWRPEVLAAVLYLGVVATAVAFVLWFTGVARLGPGTVGLCAGVAAPAAALVGAALGAPLPGPVAWLGMAAIAAGLLLGLRPSGSGGRRPGRSEVTPRTRRVARRTPLPSRPFSGRTTSAACQCEEATMPSSVGEPSRLHRRNTALAGLLIFLAVLFLAVAGLLFVARSGVDPDGASTLQAAMVGAGLAGVVLLVVAFVLRRGGWRQGPLGVERVPGGQTWAYTEVRGVATFFRSGLPVGLAWTDVTGRRAAVTAHLARFRTFYERFGADYVAARLPVVLAELEAGGTCEFALVPHAKLRAFASFGPSSYASAPTRPLLLTVHSLRTDDIDVPLWQVEQIDTSSWTDSLAFRLTDGRTLRLDYTALLDLPLVLALVDELVSRHRAAG